MRRAPAALGLLLALISACGGRTELELGVLSRSAGTPNPPAGSVLPEGGPDAELDGAVPDGPSDAGVDVALPPGVSPCIGQTQIIYVSGTPGNNLVDGEDSVAGSGAVWTTLLQSESSATIRAVAPANDVWEVILGAPFTGGALMPGDYDASFPGRTTAWMDLTVGGLECGQAYGDFQLITLEASGGDQTPITKLLASFDVTCSASEAGATIHGCVRYEP